jgi:sterol 3beta-glucosyltransferase
VKVAIVTSGSRGDVQPYVALGKGLQAAGYDVRLLGSEDFEALVTTVGLEFQSLGPNVQALTESEEWRQTLERGSFLTILRKMRAEMKGVAAQMAPRLPELLRGNDLIVAGMSGIGGVSAAAEQFAIPVVQAYVFPFTPTAAFSSPLFSRLPPVGLLNRVSFHLTHQLFWQNSKALDIAVRAVLEMEAESFWGPFRRREQQHAPVLYGYSPAFLPRPEDWGARYHVTGYWFMDGPPGWEPPADLLAFLEAGSPPVYVGFGSMRNRDPQAAGRIALEALARSGQRGVLAAGWGGINPGELPETVHAIGSIPHSWLFPRMAAVVHHGGAGTTAAGLRAGVPSVVVPFMGDQPFWGKRVAELGVGPAPIPRKKLTAELLAVAIRESVSNPEMRRRAAALGETIRGEDGVGAAVALIDGFRKRPKETLGVS